MNKAERTEIKKKVKKRYWLSYLLALLGVLLLVLAFVTPLGDLLRKGFDHESEWIPLVTVGIFVMCIVGPMLAGLGLGTSAKWELDKLYEWRRDINDIRNKHAMGLFWEAMKRKDYDEAKRLYNADKLIWGSERVLCNGILMGAACENGMDKDWKETADERMKSYL